MEMMKKLGVRGLVTPWILVLLEKEPLTGYEVMKKIQSVTLGEWKPTTGTVYPALRKLWKKKLIKKVKSGPRRSVKYALTHKGKKLVEEIREKIKSGRGMSIRKIMDAFLWPDEPKQLREFFENLFCKIVELRNACERYKYRGREVSEIIRKLERSLNVLELKK